MAAVSLREHLDGAMDDFTNGSFTVVARLPKGWRRSWRELWLRSFMHAEGGHGYTLRMLEREGEDESYVLMRRGVGRAGDATLRLSRLPGLLGRAPDESVVVVKNRARMNACYDRQLAEYKWMGSGNCEGAALVLKELVENRLSEAFNSEMPLVEINVCYVPSLMHILLRVKQGEQVFYVDGLLQEVFAETELEGELKEVQARFPELCATPGEDVQHFLKEKTERGKAVYELHQRQFPGYRKLMALPVTAVVVDEAFAEVRRARLAEEAAEKIAKRKCCRTAVAFGVTTVVGAAAAALQFPAVQRWLSGDADDVHEKTL